MNNNFKLILSLVFFILAIQNVFAATTSTSCYGSNPDSFCTSMTNCGISPYPNGICSNGRCACPPCTTDANCVNKVSCLNQYTGTALKNGICVSGDCKCPISCVSDLQCRDLTYRGYEVNGTCNTENWCNNLECNYDAQCKKINVSGTINVASTCFDSKCMSDVNCTYNNECSDATTSKNNYVCCGNYQAPGEDTLSSSITNYSCNDANLAPQKLYNHTLGEIQTFGFGSTYCSYPSKLIWLPGQCTILDNLGSSCCKEELIGYAPSSGACLNPDANQAACINSSFNWAAGKQFEIGTPNCAGDDSGEVYTIGFSKVVGIPSSVSSTKDSAAVCNNKDALGNTITKECVFNGKCMNYSTATSDNTCNGIDDDCNGYVDDGNDPSCGCFNTINGEQQRTPEIYDGIDNDCNGIIDDIYNNETGQRIALGTECKPNELVACPLNKGVCEFGKALCSFGYKPTCTAADYGPNYNIAEKCDGLDNNCDGNIDENIPNCQPTNLLYFDGKFIACSISDSTATNSIRYKLAENFKFMHLGSVDAVNDIAVEPNGCTNKGSWYCDNVSLTPIWRDAFSYDKNRPINETKSNPSNWPDNHGTNLVLPAGGLNISKCCPASFCFDGSSCVDSNIYDANHPKEPPIFMNFGDTGYRCNSKGQWKLVSLKTDFYSNDTGYCNEPDDCYAENKCYSSKSWNIFKGTDRLCLNGNWTTRTKYIAAALINYAQSYSGSDYSLYCDEAKPALGESLSSDLSDLEYDLVKYLPGAVGKTFETFTGFKTPKGVCSNNRCVNSFCVLKLNQVGREFIMIGTSLNAPVNHTTFPFYQIFGFNKTQVFNNNDPELLPDDKIYKIFSSAESGNLFYSKEMQIVFYSNDDVAEFEQTAIGNFVDSLKHPISAFLGFIKSTFTTTAEFSTVIDNIADFNKVYFARSGTKTIVGIQEMKSVLINNQRVLQSAITISYNGLTSDICKAVKLPPIILSCNSTENSQYVYGSSADLTRYDEIWPELTAKLRLQ